ncbi:MAG: excinuclease ABC subunit C [Chloroflexi bacterium RBG_19FT_COMBO_56_12]|nr:MAG: excinuclease ABC subunit C [Chloroflexi bacterium RBG_19FT_COMBO_56_12]
MEFSPHLQGILKTLPIRSGCYIMKDGEGKVIYVGKAVSLRSRVRSYFHSGPHDPKTSQLVRHIEDIEWIVVGSELEALILEMNLIKRYRPQYNVRLKDDKRYPYIKIHWGMSFPKVTVTRQIADDGGRYYGPYTSVWAVHQTLDVLRRIFPYLTCDRDITGKDERACLYYDIKLCIAPCIGAATQGEYRQMIDDLSKFLEGHSEAIVERLQNEMERASEELRYERAGAIRDQLRAIEQIVTRQKIVFPADYIDSDVIAMARSDGEACLQVFFIRGGKLIGREYFIMEGAEETPDSAVLAEFLKQFYDETPTVPAQLLLPNEIAEANIIREWLRTRRGGEKVEIRVPREGQQSELVQMAAENAAETLAALKAQWEADTHRQEQGLADLQAALGLAEPPNRIECYDISNTQGTAAVGSMVVFEQGVPKKAHYRRFNIRTVQGPDDFASMEEVLQRRFSRWQAAQEVEAEENAPVSGKKIDQAFSILPDLLLVDGGKGQLSRATAVVERFGLNDKLRVASLAKQHEEIFIPGQSESILLPRQSQGLYLVQRVRDEAHRYAITSHRARRDKAGIASQLDSIPGVGPARRKILLTHFGSLQAIRKASLEELQQAPGITIKLAETIKEFMG